MTEINIKIGQLYKLTHSCWGGTTKSGQYKYIEPDSILLVLDVGNITNRYGNEVVETFSILVNGDIFSWREAGLDEINKLELIGARK